MLPFSFFKNKPFELLKHDDILQMSGQTKNDHIF